MIQNERQYRITRAQARRFEQALARLDEGAEPDLHPLLRQAQGDALRSQLEDLRTELREYEELRSGRRPMPSLDSFNGLPEDLVRARIAAGLSQKELAERLGLKEQQIQRYEATGYAAASLKRVGQIIRALRLRTREEARMTAPAGQGSR